MSDPIAAALARYVDDLAPTSVPPFADVQRRAAHRWRRPAWLASILAGLAALLAGGLIVTVAPADHTDHRPDVVYPLPSPARVLSASPGSSGSPSPGADVLGSAPPSAGPAQGSGTTTLPGVPSGVPQHVVVHGESLHLEREVPHGVTAGWVDVADPQKLDVVAGLDLPDTGGGCYPYTQVFVLGETGTSVRLGAYDYRRDGPVTGSCPAIGGAPKVHVLSLAAPLNGRRVTDETSGVPVTDPHKLLAATYLPAGYAKPGKYWDTGQPTWTYAGPGGSSMFARLGTDQKPDATPTGAPPEYDRTIQQVTVRGRPGTAWRWSPNICVEWYESGSSPYEVCGPPDGAGAVSVEELVKVADGLTVGGG
jgi:hypothetical protein